MFTMVTIMTKYVMRSGRKCVKGYIVFHKVEFGKSFGQNFAFFVTHDVEYGAFTRMEVFFDMVIDTFATIPRFFSAP